MSTSVHRLVGSGLTFGWTSQHRLTSDDSFFKALSWSLAPLFGHKSLDRWIMVHGHRVGGRNLEMLSRGRSNMDGLGFFWNPICSASMLDISWHCLIIYNIWLRASIDAKAGGYPLFRNKGHEIKSGGSRCCLANCDSPPKVSTRMCAHRFEITSIYMHKASQKMLL